MKKGHMPLKLNLQKVFTFSIFLNCSSSRGTSNFPPVVLAKSSAIWLDPEKCRTEQVIMHDLIFSIVAKTSPGSQVEVADIKKRISL
jgi:hypothetical protein